MDKLAAMNGFVHIVEKGSLTAAAAALETSLPSVARMLAGLERELGVRLLNRTTRRLHLTEDGAQYLEHCRSVLSAIQRTEAQLASRNVEPQGRLTVTASVMFGRRYVAPIVREFLERHPRVSIELLILDRVVNIIEEGIDIAVRIGHLKDSSLIALPVGQVRRVVAASPAYLRRYGVPRRLQDLKTHRCIRHTGTSPRTEWPFRAGRRLISAPINAVLSCNDIHSSRMLASTDWASACFSRTRPGRRARATGCGTSSSRSNRSRCRST
jgi:DNA-binding transcriptional LysR family regulator